MSIIGNPIMAGGGGVTASIFVTGLSETDTVTATNGSKTLAGKWTQKMNPAFHGLPDGYTQLEYIESTGTQYIDTGIKANGAVRFKIDCTPNGGMTAIGFRDSDNYQVATDYILNLWEGGNFQVGYYGSTNLSPKFTIGERCTVSYLGNSFTAADGTITTYADASFGFDYNLFVFARNLHGTADEFGHYKLFRLELYNSESIVRDFIPARRKSDGTIGLYDLVSNSFFENAGTGTFLAGAEVPQTIEGFLIKPIRDFGTWTVTATDGTNTATQDVLVDVITEYDIEMTYKLWLYKNGDECTDVTGGWSVITSSTGTMSKQDDGIQINVGPGDETYCNIGIANTIDVTEYSKLTMRTSEVTYLHCSANVGLTLCTGTTPVKTTAYYTRPSASTSTLKISPDDLVVEDISSMTGSYNVVLGCGTGGAYSDSKINYKVYEVWLE